MQSETRERLRAQLIVDEGVRLKPYVDTVGKLTIGIGRNLTDVGITEREAYVLLDNDIGRAVRELEQRYVWFTALDTARQAAIGNMFFALGASKFSGFKKLIAAIERRDYAVAAAEVLDSDWARTVGDRALRVAAMVQTGRFA